MPTFSALRPALLGLIIATISVSACNRGNRSAPAEAAVGNPLIPETKETNSVLKRPVVDLSERVASVTSVKVEQTPTGAIIVATGTAARQGGHNIRLRPTADATSQGILQLEFVLTYPTAQTPIGSERQRQVSAAISLSTQTLQQVRTIRVLAVNNSRETRQR
jgi:hypothetical protein